ncbi:hypothetical protein, partial [Pseudomonas sp. GW460-12]|uniref:hypothetical protein n=1 Tax=Pseudomonas sp. GW460-12 TaxID=2070621 RepID=UPI001C459E9E
TGGFTGTVTLGCPAGSAFALAGYTCSFNPGQINVTGAGPETVALTLTPTVTVAGAVTVASGIPSATFWTSSGLWSLTLVVWVVAAGT